MRISLLALVFLLPFTSIAQTEVDDTASVVFDDTWYEAYVDSIEHSLKYEHGLIKLSNGVAELQVPTGFKYLNAEQAKHVLVDLWGNPPSEGGSLGMIIPENQGVMDSAGYAFNIEYEEMGYVEDDDADDIDYDELADELRKDFIISNKERVAQGYDSLTFVGWASDPFYDEEKKILHWAKEIRFASQGVNTLNYNIRILGRKGVLVINAIATMREIHDVKMNIDKMTAMAQFTAGNKYSDFDSNTDQVAAWTIGGLVAGKMLAKAGFFVVLLKFWKIIAVAVAGFFGLIWKRIKGKKDDDPMAEFTIKKNEGTK
jgi:uncharacterized membrane-anchored protein